MDQTTYMRALLNDIPPNMPILIAGPTASGKSSLALEIAETRGGIVVNADASQVFSCWRIITARPNASDEARAQHHLYGYLPHDAQYSTGHWLRDVKPLLTDGPRPIIVGGTGLYFSALTEGMADIPPTPTEIRHRADDMDVSDLIAALDADTKARLDLHNRARVQRAWEVSEATGIGLAQWQKTTGTSVLNPGTSYGIVIDAPKDFLNPRIEQRFHSMMEAGALDEAHAMRGRYDPALPSCKAIGVPQLMAVLDGRAPREQAVGDAIVATRQYAKRQRTWFRKRMKDWHWIEAASL